MVCEQWRQGGSDTSTFYEGNGVAKGALTWQMGVKVVVRGVGGSVIRYCLPILPAV